MVLYLVMDVKKAQRFLCCPKDQSELIFKNISLICKRCSTHYAIKQGIFSALPEKLSDMLSAEKWEQFYQQEKNPQQYKKEAQKYLNLHAKSVYDQLNEAKNIANKVYLEIGCGPGFFAQYIAKKCDIVIGVDFSLTALKIAKKMFDKKKIKNYLLIHGDILNLPIKRETIDIIYGGGVIEHFTETQQCVDELYRVIKPRGVSFNTVPYLNLGSLTYRQIWGNIPNVPVLKQLAEFIHIKLLKGKHMIFGYEMSFLGSTLKKIHEKAGFKKVTVSKFDVYLAFDFLPKFIKKPFIWLAKNSRLFWPMIKVIAYK